MQNNISDIATQIREKILLSTNILIVPHRNLDGDGLGCALAVKMAIDQLGRASTVAASDSKLLPGLDFLPGYKQIVHEFEPEKYDLVIFIDHSEFERTGFTERYPEWEGQVKRLVIIDHHSTTRHGDSIADLIVYADSKAPATAMILLPMFRFWDIKITEDIATCLLLGVYTDTDSFKNDYTDANSSENDDANNAALRTSAELMTLGGDLSKITQDFFQKRESGALQLWGRAMSRLKVSRFGAAVTAIYEKDFIETKTAPDALGGLINEIIRTVKDARFAILMVEKNGNIKISLRSTQFADFDVSKIAALYGGGGHKKAAGFSVYGKLREEVAWMIENT
ncbi:MAG: DHH family phosphoesterase [Patescibacteria group bacterium]|nr:DHH family phosphoesterase [Patescibacteria group bacterium]